MIGTAQKNLRFPVLCFRDNMIFPIENEEELTTCSKTALRSGYFRKLQIIDADASNFLVRDAREVVGVGFFQSFWGYNIFFNRRMRVQLEFEEFSSHLEMTEVVTKTLDALRGSQGWRSREDFTQLNDSIKNAQTVTDIAQLLL